MIAQTNNRHLVTGNSVNEAAASWPVRAGFLLMLLLLPFATVAADEKAEALSYMDAAKTLMAERGPYDVSLHLEESMEMEKAILPLTISEWRIRLDEENEFLFFAFHQRSLTVNQAMGGQLDNWAADVGVIQIRGGEVSHHRLGSRTAKRKHPDFRRAIDNERYPRLDSLGLGMFNRTVWEPPDTNEMVDRVFAKASSVEVRPSRNDAGDWIDVRAVLSDERLHEIHLWKFSPVSFVPVAYEIQKQSVASPELKRRIFAQEIQWKQDPTRGNVPVAINISAAARVQIKSSPPVHVKTRKFTDIKIVWNDFGSSRDNDQFVQDEFSLLDIDRYVKIAEH